MSLPALRILTMIIWNLHFNTVRMPDLAQLDKPFTRYVSHCQFFASLGCYYNNYVKYIFYYHKNIRLGWAWQTVQQVCLALSIPCQAGLLLQYLCEIYILIPYEYGTWLSLTNYSQGLFTMSISLSAWPTFTINMWRWYAITVRTFDWRLSSAVIKSAFFPPFFFRSIYSESFRRAKQNIKLQCQNRVRPTGKTLLVVTSILFFSFQFLSYY